MLRIPMRDYGDAGHNLDFGKLGGTMEKPVLVIMAAGMGSRYGGLKQLDPVDEYGHIIMDFSIYDAVAAGFEKVVFVIKKAIEKEFKEQVGARIAQHVAVDYVYQELTKLPEGFEVPEGREKPYGTGHAILCCKGHIHGPFAVINADDYYGKQAFAMMYDYLSTHEDDDKYYYGMVGFELRNTLTEHGHVARGICQTDGEGNLSEIHERTHIERRDGVIMYTEDDGENWMPLEEDAIASMNFWGFSESMLHELEKRFPDFLRENMEKNPLKCEFFLPSVVDALISEERAVVKVEKTKDRWYGVTYKADKAEVVAAIAQLKEQGKYPKKLWEE